MERRLEEPFCFPGQGPEEKRAQTSRQKNAPNKVLGLEGRGASPHQGQAYGCFGDVDAPLRLYTAAMVVHAAMAALVATEVEILDFGLTRHHLDCSESAWYRMSTVRTKDGQIHEWPYG